MLNLSLAVDAFERLTSSLAELHMKKYGHPSSWYAYRAFLKQMQTETASYKFRAHFELDDGVKILPPHIDRDEEDFLLDPVVLTFIRTYFVSA